MKKSPKNRAVLVATGLLLSVALTACGDSGQTDAHATAEPSATPSPTHTVAVKNDGFTTLPIYMVASSNYTFQFPDDSRPVLACGEQMVLINTVPTRTNDPVETSLNYMLNNEQFYHGSPSLMNPLQGSPDVEVTSVRTEQDTVVVELSGDLYTRGSCESAQLVAQLEMTAMAAAGTENVEVLVNNTPLREVLGVSEPYSANP